jgi:hypothetical protein
MSNCPFCKHGPIHLLSISFAYNPSNFNFIDQPCVWHLSAFMSFHPQLFNMFNECLIFVEVVVVAILTVARPKQCLHFFCAILPNLQPLNINNFVAKVVFLYKLTTGSFEFFGQIWFQEVCHTKVLHIEIIHPQPSLVILVLYSLDYTHFVT